MGFIYLLPITIYIPLLNLHTVRIINKTFYILPETVFYYSVKITGLTRAVYIYMCKFSAWMETNLLL